MASKRVVEILEQARTFHRQLEDFYAKAGDAVGREKVRMLLEYLRRHEANLAEAIERYEAGGTRKVTEAWIKVASDKSTCTCFENARIDPDMSIEDAVATALEFDDCLMEYFEDVAAKSSSPDVKEILGILLELEEKEEIQLRRTAIELEQD